MTRDDVIRMAQLAGFSPPVSADGYMGLAYDDNLQRFAAAAYAAGQVAEREARKAAQMETIALREELTKREQIAAMALQGLLSNSGGPVQESPMSGWHLCNCTEQDVAMMSINLADALLTELEK